MSTTNRVFTVSGVPTNMDSVVFTAGILRTDTSAVVVAPGTPMVVGSPGRYSYTLTDPALGLTYSYSLTATYKGIPYVLPTVYTFVGGLPPLADGTVSEAVQVAQDDTGTAIAIPADPTQELSDYASFLATEVQECPANLQERALRIAAYEFCRDTEIWREEWAISSVGGQYQYDLSGLVAESHAIVHRILEVRVGEREIPERAWRVEGNGWLHLFSPATMQDFQPIVVKVVILPTVQCTVYPKFILKRWHLGIVAGAAATCQEMDKRPWSSDRSARRNRAYYESQVCMAKQLWMSAHQGSTGVELLGEP